MPVATSETPGRAEPEGAARGLVAVLAAQAEEARPLVARLAARAVEPLASGRAWRGRLGAAEVVVSVCGMGRERARHGAQAALGLGASRLLLVGVAGALTPGLSVGSLVVAARVGNESGERVQMRDADPGAVAAAQALGGVVVGEAVTVDGIVTTRGRRTELLVKRGAAPGTALVVDLESWEVVSAAAERGVPATVLRVVSDAAQESLPSLLASAQRPDGSLDRGKVVRSALVRPASIPALLALRRRVAEGAVALADIVPRLLERL